MLFQITPKGKNDINPLEGSQGTTEINSHEGTEEINTYFNVGYAASPHEKQKDAFLRVVKLTVLFQYFSLKTTLFIRFLKFAKN